MNKKNYKKGYKGVILQLLFLCGIIPYTGLRLLDGETRMYQRAVKKLEEEGILKIEKSRGNKYIRLENRMLAQEIIKKNVDEEYIRYYQETVIKNISRMQDKKILNTERIINSTNTQIMMYACDIDSGPYKRDIATDEIENTDLMYSPSMELKRIRGYADNVKKQKNDTILNNSRISGVLISPGGIYSVYNIGKHLIEWKRYGEVRMQSYLEKTIIRKEKYIREEGRRENLIKGAIIISSNIKTYEDICTIDYTKQKNKKQIMMNIDYAYQKMYCVPQNDIGKQLLKIMTISNWETKLKEIILRPEEIEKEKTVQIACDGYDEKNNIYKLVHVIPDMVKLRAFVTRANLEEDRNKFAIYCYTWQSEMIVHLVNKNAKIYQIPIEEVIKTIEKGV